MVGGDSASLAFWTFGQELTCEFTGWDGEVVTAKATDDRFTSGTTGLSTLNLIAGYDYLKVCEALASP